MRHAVVRWGARALALFLVPVVVFVNPVHASALSNPNGWHTVEWTYEHVGSALLDSPLDVNCWLQFRYVVTGDRIEWSDGECHGIADVSPFMAQVGEPGAVFQLKWNGALPSGADCGTWDQRMTMTPHADDGVTVAGTIEGDSMGVFDRTDPTNLTASTSLCSITEACIAWEQNEWADNCIQTSLGLPIVEKAPTSSTCEHFDPSTVHVWIDKSIPTWTGLTAPANYTVLHARVKGIRKTAAAKMRIAVWARRASDGVVEALKLNVSDPGVIEDGFDAWTGIGQNGYWTEIVAVQFMSAPYDNLVEPDQDVLTHKREITSSYYTNNTYKGRNEPNYCLWHFGEKVAADDPVGTTDDPHAPVTQSPPGTVAEAPPPPPRGEEASTDPTTETGFWSAVTRLLKGIWQSIARVPSAILNGLRSLFVPDSDVINADVDRLKDAWADTPPLVLVDGVQDIAAAFTISGPTGCKGPGLHLDNPLTGPTELYLLDACGPGVSKLASITKTALTVLVYVGGFLASVRIVGAAFGLDLRLSKDGDE